MIMIRILLLGLVALVPLAQPAYGLEQSDAETVVSLLETLAYERGEPVYMDAADDWYEFDEEHSGLIAGAGFSLESWRRAYDETLLGYAGGIPESDIDQHIEAARTSLAESTLTEDQKQMILEDVIHQMEQVRSAIRLGQQFTVAVAPVRDRLEALMGDI